MIIRTWACLNRHCLNVFDGDTDFPPCTACGGIRVKWVPRPVAILSEKTKQVDKTVAQLTATYGDKNYRSPRRHESTAPKLNPAVVPGKTRRFEPAGMAGWAADLPLDAAGNPVAICAPTGVTAKLPIAQTGQKVPMSKASPGPTGSTPRYEASYRPPGGVPK